MITDYTTYADIRSALGTNEDEIADTTLALRLYEDALDADLEDVALGIPATYTSLKNALNPTDAQARFLKAARLFATYSVAKHLTTSLSVFSPVRIEDGKAGMSRVSDPHRETIKMVNQQYERWRAYLAKAFEALGQIAASTTPRPYFAIVSPSEDPATGA